MKTRYHTTLDIKGCLEFHKGTINFIEGDDGKNRQTRAYLEECRAKGYKLMPITGCEGFDPYEHGCPGHPVIEEGESESI